MAQRQEAQEDLDETVKDHIYDMQISGLDDMMDNLQEKLDDWKQDLHGDLKAQKEAIDKLTDAYNSEKIPFDLTVTTLLNGTAGEKAITQSEVEGVVSKDGSKTMNKSGDKIDTTSGDTKDLNKTGVTPTPTTVKPTENKTANAAVKDTSGNKNGSSGGKSNGSSSKQQVTKKNAMIAGNYILQNLYTSQKKGKNWGQFNKDLWRHSVDKKTGKMIDRRVFLPLKHEKKAWEKLGFNEKDFSVAKFYSALKKTGIWEELKKVRTPDLNRSRIYTGGANLGNVHGYAKGGIVHRSGSYLTDEKGEEIIITKQGILRPLSAGTSVIPADITEKLYALASNYDMGASTRVRGVDMSKLQRVGGENISPIINCPITIEGNANEQDVINAINKTLPKISKHVQNDIRKDLRKSGR